MDKYGRPLIKIYNKNAGIKNTNKTNQSRIPESIEDKNACNKLL